MAASPGWASRGRYCGPSGGRARTWSARRSSPSRMPGRCANRLCPRLPLACARQDEKLDLAHERAGQGGARDCSRRRRLAAACRMMDISREQVFVLIRDHLADELDLDATAIAEGTRFKEDLEADSLDLYTLVQELEDTYGVHMSDEQAAQILTVGQAVDFVLAHNGTSGERRP